MRIRHVVPAGLTVALHSEVEGVVQIGLSVASKHDQFSRKLGNKIASGRALTRPILIAGDIETIRYVDALKLAAVQIPEHATAVKRALTTAVEELIQAHARKMAEAPQHI